MYTVSVPINMRRLNDRTLPVFLESLNKCGAKRVFLCGQGFVYRENCFARTNPDDLKRFIDYFRKAGIEVGLWIGGFGHGFPLSPTDLSFVDKYQQMEGINGERPEHAICPLDEKFAEDYAEGLKLLASFKPDLIMIDDDFRINSRKRAYYFGCFCPLHIKEYYRRLGEEVPREKIEQLIFTGGENKYRTVYLEMMRDSLLNFAKKMRAAVDQVDNSIRLGTCATYESWDLSGTTPTEIANAFAGNTKPFSRLAGAPYWVLGWNRNFHSILETYRQQYVWSKNSGVEVFSEGDTYPKNRFVIPAKLLEVFDLALACDGGADGNLAYMYDYETKPEYEDGYADTYARIANKRKEMQEIFNGKKAAGIRVYNEIHKIKKWKLPDVLERDIACRMEKTPISPASFILSRNSIPTTYEKSDLPVLLYGENARYISEEDLTNGAILDIPAAMILEKRGIDTGLAGYENGRETKALYATRITSSTRELFPNENVAIPSVAASHIKKITCKEGAEILSSFVPDNTPASYRYENKNGQKFLVLAYDHYAAIPVPNPYFENSYCRQAEIINEVERMCGKKLPAVCKKHPDLYMLTSKDESSMAVALFNLSLNDVYEPEITLDKCYGDIRFVDCSGTLSGNTVKLSDIPPYGSAAFEVR